MRNIGTAVLEAVESVVLAPPRSPFNTGSVDVTTAGAASLTDGRLLATEKQVMIVRHGLTTWNEQRRIQARRQRLLCSCDTFAVPTKRLLREAALQSRRLAVLAATLHSCEGC